MVLRITRSVFNSCQNSPSLTYVDWLPNTERGCEKVPPLSRVEKTCRDAGELEILNKGRYLITIVIFD